MRSIIDKHYHNLRFIRNTVKFDLQDWYVESNHRYKAIPDLIYNTVAFISVINTTLHLRIAKRLSLGLDVYGKES